MFDLESAVKNWRQQTAANWTGGSSALDELEDHLREEIAALTRSGQPEQAAFTKAVARLGDSSVIRREFAKIDRLPAFDRWSFAVLLTSAVAVVIVAFAAIIAMRGQVMQAQPVLSFHIVTITIGYLTGLFAAVIASYGAIRTYLSPNHIPALTSLTLRIVRWSSITAAVLTLLGFALGAVWLNGALGQPFDGDPREIGAIIVFACLIATAIAARREALPARFSLAIAIAAGGSILVAWFGVALYFANFPPLFTAITLAGIAAALGLCGIALSLKKENVSA